MLNPLQTTLTHAEPVFDTFSAALGRSLRAIGYALEASGMIPRGKARATYAAPAATGHAYPLVVVSCVAGGPDLPHPGDLDGTAVRPVDLDLPPDTLEPLPDLEADGYGWGPRAGEGLARGLLYGCAPEAAADVWPTETPC